MRHIYRRLTKKRSTLFAQQLKEALEERGIKVDGEKWDGHKHIDLVIHAARINIEVDGLHHLLSKRQILADLDRSYYSDAGGYSTIHIHNQEIFMHLPQIANALAGAARARMHRFSGKCGLSRNHICYTH